ncbi:MAG: phosphatidate cytidylyltransferase [Saprospiraceae bacterium]|nr:phosphatidate cytidylyltransferase [Saprospiraceae bacterium]
MNKNQVLRQRTSTGILFGLVVLSLLYISSISAIFLLVLIAGIGSSEYFAIVRKENEISNLYMAIPTLATIVLCFLIDPNSIIFFILTILSMIFCIAGIVHLWKSFFNHKKLPILISTLYLGLPLGLTAGFVYHSPDYPRSVLISLILLIWANDSFAYLVGSRIGKTKLFESISPKKTWEGFLGGIFFTLLTAIIIHLLSGSYSMFIWIVIALTVSVIGTLGDLFESSLKRNFKVKDSGNLLPGHGGILDRFDSFIYILPFILFLLLF